MRYPTFLISLACALITAPTDAQSVWTKRSSPTGANLFAVTWAGSQLVAVGDSGTILTSPDGIAWTKRLSGTTNSLRGVAWSGNLLVVVGWGASPFSSPPTILTSPDGITWNARSTGTSNLTLESVGWSGTQFIAGGSGFNVCGFSSTNGTTWTSIPASAGPCNSQAMTWTGTMWVSPGLGELFTSANGTSWTNRLTTNAGFYDVAWNGTRMVAVDALGNAYSSTNGTSWDSTKVSASTLPSIVWTGTRYVTLNSNGAYVSENGSTWTLFTADPGVGQNYGLAWTGSLLVSVGSNAAGSNGEIFTSPHSSVALAGRSAIHSTRRPAAGTHVRILDAAGRTVWPGKGAFRGLPYQP